MRARITVERGANSIARERVREIEREKERGRERKREKERERERKGEKERERDDREGRMGAEVWVVER